MFPDIPDEITDYYKEKARDLPKAQPSPVHDLMAKLDSAVVAQLYHDGSQANVTEAFDAVINHPESTWKPEVLSYRLRCLYYS